MPESRHVRVALDSIASPGGRICLSHEAGRERSALFAASMIADILGERVSLTGSESSDVMLHIHAGNVAPEPRRGAPCLVIPLAEDLRTSRIRLERAPWNPVPEVSLANLPWVLGRHEPLQQADGVWWLNADLPELAGRESLRHDVAQSDMRSLLGAQLAMRSLLSTILPLRAPKSPALSLITIDAEDQQRYFVNSEGRCSNIRGKPDADMQFANSCRTIMERCETEGLKAVFMVTGDEIATGFADAFGDPLIGLEDNRRVLDEMTRRGHDVACHGYDHEWWISRGVSAITPMSMMQKLKYFFQTSGDIRTLLGLARFLLVYGTRVRRARSATRQRSRTLGKPFTVEDMHRDLDLWSQCTGFSGDRLFIRYPGYVRSPATVQVLDERYALTVDSSDLYEAEWGLPAFPYRLFTLRDNVLRRSRIIEIPCIWIDKLLRTRDAERVAANLETLRKLAAVPGSVLSFITHTKVLGATWGHCHVYLHDPLKGMALPASENAWRAFAAFLRSSTRSANWRDLQRDLADIAA